MATRPASAWQPQPEYHSPYLPGVWYPSPRGMGFVRAVVVEGRHTLAWAMFVPVEGSR